MKALVNILNALDEFFKGKSENEKWMILLMIFVVIGYLSYTLFLPYAQDAYNSSVRTKQQLQKSIATHNEYLSTITKNGDRDYYIKKYDHDIEGVKKQINITNDDINFISSNLDELSPLLFNKKSWSNFLNSITKEAKEQTVNINYIDNNYVDNNGSFGHILQIAVGCDGEYKNIIKFINRLEKNVLVTDIYGSHIYMDKNASTTFADINISVWGINH
ncbi:MAG: hypothetical protein KU29_05720 [Sulfurovum sp. FS06-10]|jgi:hypothetical protein|nr:MAG: hypothetical protein KU29_05720 [Sulfurovum sp. FS06-10]